MGKCNFPNKKRRYSFRPLSGYLISKWDEKIFNRCYCSCFRPLSGYLISKYNMYPVSSFFITVSVPSRGILFPNFCLLFCSFNDRRRFRPLSGYLISKYEKERMMYVVAVVFPSPLGVSYFQIEMWLTNGNGEKFPSPLGVSYFQISCRFQVLRKEKSVSVPSRGILFPNDKTNYNK